MIESGGIATFPVLIDLEQTAEKEVNKVRLLVDNSIDFGIRYFPEQSTVV
jgi:hypothetical protein